MDYSNSAETHDQMDSQLTKAMQKRAPSKVALGSEDLLLVAMGKLEKPSDMDKGQLEILNSLKEMVKHTESYDPLNNTVEPVPFYEHIAISISKGIGILASSFTLTTPVVALRGEESAPTFSGATANGTGVSLSRGLTGDSTLELTWTSGNAPSKVILHKDGQISDSIPITSSAISLKLRGTGLYRISSFAAGESVEELSIPV
jgi:hypothetical protein